MSKHNGSRKRKQKATKSPHITETLSSKSAKPSKQIGDEPPFGILYFRAMGGAGLLATLFGLAFGVSYHWSVFLIYAGCALLALDLAYEPRLKKKWRVSLAAPFLVVLFYFTLRIVLHSAAMETSVRAVGAYKADSAGIVWGVPWQPYYYGVDLTIGNPSSSEDYSNVEFIVYADLPLVEFALKTPRGCQGMSLSRVIGSGDLTNVTAQTTQVIGVPNGMEVKCTRIAKKEFLPFLLAIYPLDRHRKSIYEPLVPIKPSFVEIKGSFETSLGKPHKIFAHIPVPEPERADSTLLGSPKF